MTDAVDPKLVALATQFSLPPSVLYGVQTMAQDKSDAAMALVARSLSEQFQKQRSWEGAVSAVVTGDPQTHANPTNPSAGKVNAILGIAASRPQYGMQNWKPLDLNAYAGAAKAMQKTATSLAKLGGVVTPEHVQAWSQAITTVKHPPAPARPQADGQQPPQPPPPPPDIHSAAAVGEFASKLKAMGATPEHFKQLFPAVATAHRALLGKKQVTVDDFAAHVGQTPDMVLQSVRAMPSHKSPAHTAGEFDDMWRSATLNAPHHLGRMPYVSEVSSFLSAGYKHGDVDNYYKRMAQKRAGLDTSGIEKNNQPQLQVMEGGQSGNA